MRLFFGCFFEDYAVNPSFLNLGLKLIRIHDVIKTSLKRAINIVKAHKNPKKTVSRNCDRANTK